MQTHHNQTRTERPLVFFVRLLVLLGVVQFGDDLPGVSARVVPVGVLARLLLGALLAAVRRVDVFLMLEVVVLVLVEVGLRHLRL